jgi:hypothetical protein
MRKFLAPASIAMTMAMSGAALADFGSNTTASSMVRPNVYYEAQNAAYAEPRPDSIAPASDIRGYLYSEGSQIAYTPVSPDSVNPDQELDESVYGIE